MLNPTAWNWGAKTGLYSMKAVIDVLTLVSRLFLGGYLLLSLHLYVLPFAGTQRPDLW